MLQVRPKKEKKKKTKNKKDEINVVLFQELVVQFTSTEPNRYKTKNCYELSV